MTLEEYYRKLQEAVNNGTNYQNENKYVPLAEKYKENASTSGANNKGNALSWIAKNFHNSMWKSVLDTTTAPIQSSSVGFQRGVNQASQEKTTFDKVYNTAKNIMKYTSNMDPVSRLMYNASFGYNDFKNQTTELANQIADKMSQVNDQNLLVRALKMQGALAGGISSFALQQLNPVMQSVYDESQFAGQLLGQEKAQKTADKLRELDENIHKGNDKRAEELAKEGENYGWVTQKAGQVAQTIGYMTPSIAISAVTGGSSGGEALGLVQMGLASKSNTTREALKQGANYETAERKGVASGTIESSSELMFGGLKAFKPFKKSGFEDTAKKWIEGQIKEHISSKMGQKVLNKVYSWFIDVAGESVEELTTDIYNTWLDQSTTDPNKEYTLQDAVNTVFSTILSTTALNIGYSGWNKGSQELYKWNEARKEGKNKVTPEIQSNSDTNKTNLQSMINNLDLPQKIKQEAQSIINSDAIVTEEGYNDFKESIKKMVETNTQRQYDELKNNVSAQYDQIEAQIEQLDEIKPENFQDAESRKFYAQQVNAEYDTTAMDSILAMYPENRNGKRTVKAYKEIARQYGQQMAQEGLNFDQVRANTVGAWQQYEPNKNITRYDNKEHKNQGFDRLNSQVWSQEVYDSYKETMTNQLKQQQKALQTEYTNQFQEIEDNGKALLMTIDNLGQQVQESQNNVEISNDDNLISSAEKYGYDFKNNNLKEMQQALDKRGIKGQFNGTYFTDKNGEVDTKTGALWNVTTDENGNKTRSIILNPYADESTLVQEMEIHELVHDIIEGKTQTSKELYDEILSYMQQDKGYAEVREQLEDIYSQRYDKNSPNFKDMIDEEVVAKALQTKFGNQEEISRLVKYNPNKARSIYDKVVSKVNELFQKYKGDNKLLNKAKDYIFWKNVQNKFEYAYSQEGNYNVDNDTRYLALSKNARKDLNSIFTETQEQATKTSRELVRLKDNTISKLVEYGIPDLPMVARRGHIRENILTDKQAEALGFSTKNKHFHGLGVNTYLDIIDSMDTPVGVYQYTNKGQYDENNFIVLTPVKIDGKNAIVPVEISKKGRENQLTIDTNRIKSVYAKDNANYINNMLKQGKIKEVVTGSTSQQAPLTKYSIPNNGDNVKYSVNTNGEMIDKKGNKITLEAESGSSDRTLLAIHNLNAEKLEGVLELGGFPVPSIAIANPNTVAHSEFGDISVVFDKETINPVNRKNEVYDRDVWSPTFPSVNYDINNKDIKKYVSGNLELDRRDPIINDAILDFFYQENLSTKVERYGLEKTLEIIKESKPMKYLYLTQVDKSGFKPSMKLTNFSNSNDYTNQELQRFLDEYKGNKPLNELTYDETVGLEKQIIGIIEDHLNEEANKISSKEYREEYKKYIKEIVSKYKDNYNLLNNFIYSANSMQTKGADSQVIDESKTLSYVDDAINQQEFEKWVDNTFGKMFNEAKKGIRNDKELFTPSGNRRSFNQLYDEYNLTNIVKALTKGSTKGGQEDSIFGVGFGRISAQTANQFKSIEDIKNNENRLMTREQAEEIIRPLAEDLFAKIDNVADYYTRKDYGSDMVNKMQGVDTASELVEEFASGKLSVDRLKTLFGGYDLYEVDKIPTELFNGIIDDLKQIKNLPTDYFEAKPQRAVTFDEIDTIVLPSNTSEDIKQALKDRGINYIEYDSNNENARGDILKSLDEYKFNKEATNFDEYLKNKIGKTGTRTTLGELKLPTNQSQQKLPTKQVNQPKTQQVETKEANLPMSQETTSVPLNNQKQRRAYKSIIESEMMSDEAKAIAKKFIGQDTYTPDSNAKQLSRADDRIQRNGVEKELNALETNAMEGKTIKADDIAVGDRLIQYYSKVGDLENLQRAIRATAMAGTQAGRSVQAFALLRHQTPEGMAIWIQNSVDKLNSKTKNGQFDFTQEMQEKILNSTEENLQENVDEVMKELGQQVPKDTLSKLDAWRYFSMLANPKTHIRNIVGNFAMGLTQRVSNKVAGTIEQVTGRDRTKTSIFERRSKANIEFAKNDLKNVSSQLGIGTSKYSNPQNAIQQNQRTFKSDALEKSLGRMFNLNDNLLEAEDNFGLKNAYVRNLSDYMSANKLNPNTITNEQLQKARAIAIDKALEATFHQASNLASVLNQLENKNIGTRLLLGGLVPFKKTPINVAKAGAEYSPAGLAKSLVYDTVQLRKGNINTNQWIDNISKGLTGTGIAVLGYALAKAGILKAGGDDDKEDKYKQAMGDQPYAVTINGKSYSLDWLAPSGIPLFVGAELAKIVDDKTEKDGETENEVLKAMGRVADATSSLLNPMSEMSMISGITSTIQSFSQDSGQALMNLVVSPLKSYVGQTVPTALGQIARTMDTYERDTSSTETGLLPKAIDQTKNQIMNKIPGLRQMLPTKKDIWGEEVETQDYFHNAVLPYTEKEIKSNPVDTELNSLYEKTGENIYPNTSLAKTVTYEGSKTRLTNQDYNEFKESYGKNSYRILNNLINSNEYKSLSDEQKVKAIQDVYTYANNLNKYNYAQKKGITFETPSDVEKVNAIKANGGSETDYFKYKGITDGLTKDSEKISAIQNSKLSNKSKRAVYNATVGKDDTFYQSTDIDVNEYLKYKTANIEGTKDENGKTISGTKKQAQLDYINDNISGYENRLLLMGKDYKLSRSQQQDLASYIDTLPNADELFELLSKNFTVKDGTVYYK